MINGISNLIAAVLTVLMLYVYPAMEAATKHDDFSRLLVHNTVMRFVDAVRTKGYICPQMYTQFEEELCRTGNHYDVHMEHLHQKYVPDYTDPIDPTTFSGKYETAMDAYYQAQILPVLFPKNSHAVTNPSRRYILTTGDYFTVHVINTNYTTAAVFRESLNFHLGKGSPTVYAIYGGMIINEDY